MRYSFIGIMLSLMLAATSCSGDKQTGESVKRVRISTVVAAGEGTATEYPGKVVAAEDADLSFRVSGTIDKYCVEEGQRVVKGQLLVLLDSTDYRVQLDATEAEYSQVKAEAERVMRMYADSVATPNDYDKAVYGLRQMEAKLKNHRDQLAYTRLYAPFSGIIQKHLREAHENTMAGMPVISIISDGGPEVEINLPASEYVGRAAFSAYSCRISVFPGRTFNLRPISISPKANSNQLYTMRLAIEADGGLMPSPGINALVRILKSDEGALLQVPTGAVGNKDGRAYIFIYNEKESMVRQADVSVVGLTKDGSCTIECTGLKAGDKVVSAGIRSLSDGDKVEAISEAGPSNVGGLL